MDEKTRLDRLKKLALYITLDYDDSNTDASDEEIKNALTDYYGYDTHSPLIDELYKEFIELFKSEYDVISDDILFALASLNLSNPAAEKLYYKALLYVSVRPDYDYQYNRKCSRNHIGNIYDFLQYIEPNRKIIIEDYRLLKYMFIYSINSENFTAAIELLKLYPFKELKYTKTIFHRNNKIYENIQDKLYTLLEKNDYLYWKPSRHFILCKVFPIKKKIEALLMLWFYRNTILNKLPMEMVFNIFYFITSYNSDNTKT